MRKPAPALVRIRDGELRRGRRVVLTGVNVAVLPGITAILGPNGAGKSTLLRAIATLGPLAAGSLAFGDVTVRSHRDVRAVRRSVGYLAQEPRFPDRFTVAEAVTYAAWLHKTPGAPGVVDGALERFELANQGPVPEVDGASVQAGHHLADLTDRCGAT